MRQIIVAVGIIVAGILGPALFGKDKEKDKGAPVDLVWPGPPEKPRIRYLGAIQTVEDVAGRTKQSVVERMSGKPPQRKLLRLEKPYGVAVDGGGRIYIADPQHRGVLVFDREAKTAALRKGNGQFPLFVPIGVAVNGRGRMYVSDSFTGQIVVFDASKPVAAFGKGTLQRPGGMAYLPARNQLYVADVKRNEILAFDADSYKLIRTIGGSSKHQEYEAGTFSGPTNLAFDGQGRLHVTDTWNCRIQIFTPDGVFLHMFGAQGVRPGFFTRPKGLGVDSEGHIYVVDAGFSNFQIFTSQGKPLLFVGSPGDEAGQFMLPAGLAVDEANRIYITEQRPGGGRLQIFQYLTDAKPPQASPRETR